MPRPDNLDDLEVNFTNGYWPSAPEIPRLDFLGTMRAGSNVWLRSQGRPEVANGLLQTSATNVGARLFAGDVERISIEGGLNGDLLPYAGFLRYANAAFIYLSEDTSAQVYVDETAVTGLTTSSTAGRLRVAIPDGAGGYDVYDAGFDKPELTSGDVDLFTAGAGVFGQIPMAGSIGVAIAPWRTKTNAIGPPSEIVYNDVPPSGSSMLRIALPTPQSGQDGWIYCGTRWADRGGELRVVRYVYVQPRGTFTATNGSPTITAGIGTFFTQDLYRGDQINIDASAYEVLEVTSNTQIELTANFTGSTGAGKTTTMATMAANWYNSGLRGLVDRDIVRAPRAAGVLQYGKQRVFLWGVPDTNSIASTEPTGNAILACADNNPEHVVDPAVFSIVTESGSNLVNVLPGDGVLYLLTTTDLEIVTFTNDPNTPYTLRTVAKPGFKAGTNGVLYKDWLHFFNGRPGRTRARENIDVKFAEPVWSDMEDWDASRVMLAVDPLNDAVLYIFDDGAATTVLPYMAQLGIWGPPLNFSARIIDTANVNGKLYVTYLSGGNYRVNEWEGGTGIGGTRYAASQYYNSRLLRRNRLKNLAFAGKAGFLRVYAAPADGDIPDVTDTGVATASFTLSDTDKVEPEISTNIEGVAFAFRIDFSSNDGQADTLAVRGLPRN